MTDISCSNGDLSSTPSNRSEYFSVTSSLNILNSNDEVYHSFDEDLPDGIQCETLKFFSKKFEHHKIVKQNHLEIDIDYNLVEDMMIENQGCRNSVECEFLEKEIINNENTQSQDSINSYEDDLNHNLTFSNSHQKRTLLTDFYNKESVSDNELSISDSANNTAQIISSHIEGELSDINDIIYDSSTSPYETQGLFISKENDSSEIETDNNDLSQTNNIVSLSHDNLHDPGIVHDQIAVEFELDEKQFPALEMVRPLERDEFFQVELNDEQFECKGSNDAKHINESDSSHVDIDNINQSEIADVKNELVDETANQRKFIETTKKKSLIEYTEDSPIKKSYLCCSIRRKRKKESPKMNFIQKFRARRIFSFFNSSDSSKKLEPEVVSEPINNSCENPISIKSIGFDYDGIPFIDADVIIDSEAYITLAKQELFLE